MRTASATRYRISLLLAVGLHLLGAALLPQWRVLRAGADQAASALAAEPGVPQAETLPVIPIRLPASPAGNWELETRLGAIEGRAGPAQRPGAELRLAALGGLELSVDLQAAAREAQRAYEGLQQPLTPEAELQLAAAPLALSAGDAATSTPAVPAVAPLRPAPAPSPGPQRRMPQPAPRAEPERPAVAARRRASPPADDNIPQREPLPEASEPDGPPPIFESPPSHAVPPPQLTAEAAPRPLWATAATAPDLPPPAAGAGKPTSRRSQFFSELTAHLFLVNQQVLAEAVRATPRLTLEVRFTIDRAGRVIDVRPVRSSGDARLDDRAMYVIRRASPVPQMSPDMPQTRLELSFPVQIYR